MRRAFILRVPLVAALLMVTSLSGAGTGDAPPLLCGTGPKLGTLLSEFHAANPFFGDRIDPLRRNLIGGPGDRISGDLILIEDMGDLVVGGVTDTTAIVERALAVTGDRFDFITVFAASTFPADVSPEQGFAFFHRVGSGVSGVGLPLQNQNGTLQGFINLNDLGEYPGGPSGTIAGFNGVVSGVELLGHEAAHWVEAYINVGGVQVSGRDASHWSFYMQSYGSVMEGNLWVDEGDGLFTTAPTASQYRTYSQLDLYLWGLRPAAGVVEPMWVIAGPTQNPGQGRFSLPQGGFTTAGTRVDFDINDVIVANGDRQPSFPAAPDVFTMAFVLVIPSGQQPSPADVTLMNDFRTQFESWFSTHTQGAGTMVTTLPPIPVGGDFSVLPQAGGPAPLTVQFSGKFTGSVTEVLWNFGDGESSTEFNPLHTYLADDRYTVSLRIEGVGGPVIVTKPDAVVVGNFTPVLADDFEAAGNWAVDPSDTAVAGRWQRGDPEGTWVGAHAVQPEDDATPAPGVACFVTGAAAGSSTGANDVDSGATTLLSPSFSLPALDDAFLGYAYWYSNDRGPGAPDDVFTVDISNDGGGTWSRVQTVTGGASRWRKHQVRINDLLNPTGSMRVRFIASDLASESLVEAAVDDVSVIGLFESDTDGDGVPDGLDNCPTIDNASQTNDDGDPRGDACDCAPFDPAIWRRPGAVPEDLHFSNQTTIRWSPVDQATSYNLFRGEFLPASEKTYNHSCRGAHLQEPEYIEADVPAVAGSVHYFLAAAENCFGQGSLGLLSPAIPRPNAACP